MRLLAFTQAIDKNDPIMGFFHRWVEELAKRFDSIDVICLKEGPHTLPPHVRVHSLGKESGESRMKYVFRFYRHLLALHGSYDRVFVHMNPHYVILGGLYWKVRGIPVFFWRNHARMNLLTAIAARLSKRVFYTSPYACTAKYAHAVRMPVGIDHTFFSPGDVRAEDGKTKVLFLGRLSPVKRAELCLSVARVLGEGYEIHMYGDAPSRDRDYGERLRSDAPTNVTFHPGVKNDETPAIYRMFDAYLNLTPEGSMDKTVLEAASTGTLTVVTNRSFSDALPEEAIATDSSPESVAQCIRDLMKLDSHTKSDIRARMRESVIRHHSLQRLGIMLYDHMQ